MIADDATAAPPAADPAAPLEAYIRSAAYLLSTMDPPPVDDDATPVAPPLGSTRLTLGDLRRAAAAIRVLSLQFDLLRGLAFREPPGDGDGVTWKEEAERLREERDIALRMFAKARHRGPWTLTPAEWVARGRLMAGLKAEGPPEPQETHTP